MVRPISSDHIQPTHAGKVCEGVLPSPSLEGPSPDSSGLAGVWRGTSRENLMGGMVGQKGVIIQGTDHW